MTERKPPEFPVLDPIDPPTTLEGLPFEVLDIENLGGREYRVFWRTIADDGLPEETSQDIKVPASANVEHYIEDFLAEKKLKRCKANAKGKERREREKAEESKTAKQKQPLLLNKVKNKVDQKGKRPS
jgi:hypothetical protein